MDGVPTHVRLVILCADLSAGPGRAERVLPVFIACASAEGEAGVGVVGVVGGRSNAQTRVVGAGGAGGERFRGEESAAEAWAVLATRFGMALKSERRMRRVLTPR
jgi:hypothetical protein